MYKVGDILEHIERKDWGKYQIIDILSDYYSVMQIDKKVIGRVYFLIEDYYDKVNKFSVGDKVRLSKYPYRTGEITKVIAEIAQEYYSDDPRISYEESIGTWSWENQLELIENSKSAAISNYKLGQEVYFQDEIKVGDIVDLSKYYRDGKYINYNFKVKNIKNNILTVEININKNWVKKT